MIMISYIGIDDAEDNNIDDAEDNNIDGLHDDSNV